MLRNYNDWEGVMEELQKIFDEAIKKSNKYYKNRNTNDEEKHFNKGFDIWLKPIRKLLREKKGQIGIFIIVAILILLICIMLAFIWGRPPTI